MVTEKLRGGATQQDYGQLWRLSVLGYIPNVQVILVRGCGNI